MGQITLLCLSVQASSGKRPYSRLRVLCFMQMFPSSHPSWSLIVVIQITLLNTCIVYVALQTSRCIRAQKRSFPGSKMFVEEQAKSSGARSAESIIGQFGVGFYSAFMVASKVVVKTRKEGTDVGYVWEWNGLFICVTDMWNKSYINFLKRKL